MPRRIHDYSNACSGWNIIASYGSYLSALFFFCVIYIILTEKGKEDHAKLRIV